MLSENELNEYIEKFSLSERAAQYIREVRSGAASRMVGTHAKNNLCSWIPSRKMGHTVSIESAGPEKAFYLACEYDERVIEFWDQPEPVKICRTNKNGRISRGYYTPDALVLGNKGPRVFEVKTREFVDKKLADHSPDWECLANGNFRYVPAFEVFGDIGLTHDIFAYDSRMAYKTANIELLLHSRIIGCDIAEAEEKIDKLFKNGFFFTLEELRDQAGIDSCLPLIRLIDNGRLFVDLDTTMLSCPEGCVVTRDGGLLEHALDVFRVGEIASVGSVSSLPVSSISNELAAASALKNLSRLKGGANGRSQRRHCALVKLGTSAGLSEFQSLIPQYHRSGNRLPKVATVVKRTLLDYLLDDHLHRQGLSTYRSYTRYLMAAKEMHPLYDPVSRTTFSTELKKVPEYKRALAVGGRRSANAAAAPSDPVLRALKPLLPWQIAAIDHYKADLYLIVADANGTFYVARPWVSMMLDRFSGKVLGFAVSFADPSRRAICKVLRDCVRKHGRLPSEIISDRGPDFRSVYYEALLAHYDITYTLRPAAHGRYGGEVEGIFGEFKRQWLCQLPGNLTKFENARSFDGKKRPDKCAVLRTNDFIKHLQQFVAWRDRKARGASAISAQSKFESPSLGASLYGRDIEYGQEFLLATAVETQEYKVDFQRGLHIGDMWYWNPTILVIEGRKSHLEVRIDPENPHVVYALIGGEWIPCHSSQVNSFAAKDQISQLVDGLLISEGRAARRKAFEDADIKAVRKIAELDALANSDGSLPVAWVDTPDEDESLFDSLFDSEIQVLETELWGDSK